MSLYYVYMNLAREYYSTGRILLTCESRYVADEFFRALQAIESPRSRKFTILERNTPQFWLYDTAGDNPPAAIPSFIRDASLPRGLNGRVMSVSLDDSRGCGWVIAPVIRGRDWVNNRTYFIRNIRQPHLYWFCDQGQVTVSQDRKTRFRVRAADPTLNDKTILTRPDLIRISTLPETGAHETYINMQSTGSTWCKSLTLTCDWKDWRFQDLLGRFGTMQNVEGGKSPEIVIWSDNSDQDDWELC